MAVHTVSLHFECVVRLTNVINVIIIYLILVVYNCNLHWVFCSMYIFECEMLFQDDTIYQNYNILVHMSKEELVYYMVDTPTRSM